MTSFLLAVFFLLITPGPGVLTTAGVGSAYGAATGYRYVSGLFVGTNLVALAVVTGVAGLVLAEPFIRTLLFYAATLYLLWLALKIALAGSRVSFIESSTPPGFVNGIALQAINPKAYVVNTTLFTGFAFSGMSSMSEIIWKFLLINLVWIPIHLLWLAAGIGLRQLALSARAQRIINVAMATSLLLVVGLAAWSETVR